MVPVSASGQPTAPATKSRRRIRRLLLSPFLSDEVDEDGDDDYYDGGYRENYCYRYCRFEYADIAVPAVVFRLQGVGGVAIVAVALATTAAPRAIIVVVVVVAADGANDGIADDEDGAYCGRLYDYN